MGNWGWLYFMKFASISRYVDIHLSYHYLRWGKGVLNTNYQQPVGELATKVDWTKVLSFHEVIVT